MKLGHGDHGGPRIFREKRGKEAANGVNSRIQLSIMNNGKRIFNQGNLIAVTAILSVINGSAYLFFAGPSLALLGLHTDGLGLMNTRYFGACAIGYGMLLWLLRKSEAPGVSKAILASILVCLGLSAVVGFLGVFGGSFNRNGWFFVLTDALLALASGYFLAVKGQK
jgi:hypothetical protein